MTTPPEYGPAYPAAPPPGGFGGAGGFGGFGEPEVPWRRLDPRMLAVAPVQEIAKGIIPIAVIAFAGGGDPIRLGIGAFIGVVLAALGVVRYLTTTYRVTPQRVEVRRGLLTRTTSAAPLDRVRSIDVTSPFLHRMFGLGKVVVGTGRTGGDGDKNLVLDSLGSADAERLRADLWRRARGGPAGTTTAPDGSVEAPPQLTEDVLVAAPAGWVRYAPFTLSGVITGAVIIAFAGRLLNEARVDLATSPLTRDLITTLQRTPVWADVVVGVVLVLLLTTLLSVVAYVLAYHRFRLTRRSDGTLHITRGLLTRRETTLEHRRVRGVELNEPLLLRAVRGARLLPVATGLRGGANEERSASVLVPPSPRDADLHVGAEITGDRDALEGPLQPHGRAATNRRYTRAIAPVAVVVVAVLALVASGVLPTWAYGVVVLVPLAASLARDRARSLGHRVGGPLVVTRAGSLVRRRAVFARDGVIGAVVRSSPFQRRQGVVTVFLTTAAGRQAYAVVDVPVETAWNVIEQALPAGIVERNVGIPRS